MTTVCNISAMTIEIAFFRNGFTVPDSAMATLIECSEPQWLVPHDSSVPQWIYYIAMYSEMAPFTQWLSAIPQPAMAIFQFPQWLCWPTLRDD